MTTEEIENKLDNGDISMFSTAIIQVGHWLRFSVIYLPVMLSFSVIYLFVMLRRPLQLRSN